MAARDWLGRDNQVVPRQMAALLRCAHLSVPKTGRVLRASVAGNVGRTGNITCEKTHLHFEVKDNVDGKRAIDPASESAVFQWSVEP